MPYNLRSAEIDHCPAVHWASDMPKLTLQIRTRDNLAELLTAGESPAWKINVKREPSIDRVRIVNFDGTKMIDGKYERARSHRRNDGRLIVCFSDARIVNCRVSFDGRNPVRYLES
jgi:hypothetical protein